MGNAFPSGARPKRRQPDAGNLPDRPRAGGRSAIDLIALGPLRPGLRLGVLLGMGLAGGNAAGNRMRRRSRVARSRVGVDAGIRPALVRVRPFGGDRGRPPGYSGHGEAPRPRCDPPGLQAQKGRPVVSLPHGRILPESGRGKLPGHVRRCADPPSWPRRESGHQLAARVPAERIGARLGLSEALLGLLAALAADAPEITAAVTALLGHHAAIGAGVAIGSNVFNLAALLGLSSIIAGRIALHRRVILLQGTVAVAVAALAVAVVAGALPAGRRLGSSLAVLVPFVALLGMAARAPGPAGTARRLGLLADRGRSTRRRSSSKRPSTRPGRAGDVLVASVAVVESWRPAWRWSTPRPRTGPATRCRRS